MHLGCTTLCEKSSLKSPGAVYLSADTNTDPDAAHAMFLPAHNRMFQQVYVCLPKLYCFFINCFFRLPLMQPNILKHTKREVFNDSNWE